MKIGWRRKTDEEIISLVRDAYQKFDRWKWALMSFYSALFVTIIMVALTNVCYPNGLEILFDQSRYQPSPTMITYAIGISAGLAIGFFVSLFGFLMINTLMELRAWKLLLAYHDRLQQAGLLPSDDEVKMKRADPPPSGS